MAASVVPGRGSPGRRLGRREPPGEDRFGHRRGADRPVRRGAAPRCAGGPGAPPQPAQLLQDGVEAHAGDELHHVVVMAVVPPHAEDRDDVGVVQPRRRPRLPLEPQHLLGVGQGRVGEDLQGHAPAERLLLGLVDHAHAAAADLAEDAVVAQPLQRRGRRRPRRQPKSVRVAHPGLVLLHQQQRREQRVDPVGPLRVTLGVLGRARGASPRRCRATNSSASRSTGSRSFTGVVGGHEAFHSRGPERRRPPADPRMHR